jgi:hypothetical protein
VRQRPPRSDVLQASCVRARQRSSDLIVQEAHLRVAGRHGGALHRRGEGADAHGAHDRSDKHGHPPAHAGGCRYDAGEVGHPVKRDGPDRGLRSALAIPHARYGIVSVRARVASVKVTRALTMWRPAGADRTDTVNGERTRLPTRRPSIVKTTRLIMAPRTRALKPPCRRCWAFRLQPACVGCAPGRCAW